MPKDNIETSLFFKTENSFSATSNGNYTGIGARFTTENAGTFEGLTAFKSTDSAIGGFQEVRYTTPEIGNSNLYVESKGRVLLEDAYDGPLSVDATEQLALKGSWKLGSQVGLYQLAGATSKFSLQGAGVKSVAPISITGVSCNPTPKSSAYCELVLSKPYDFQKKAWGEFSPSVCVGLRITF